MKKFCIIFRFKENRERNRMIFEQFDQSQEQQVQRSIQNLETQIETCKQTYEEIKRKGLADQEIELAHKMSIQNLTRCLSFERQRSQSYLKQGALYRSLFQPRDSDVSSFSYNHEHQLTRNENLNQTMSTNQHKQVIGRWCRNSVIDFDDAQKEAAITEVDVEAYLKNQEDNFDDTERQESSQEFQLNSEENPILNNKDGMNEEDDGFQLHPEVLGHNHLKDSAVEKLINDETTDDLLDSNALNESSQPFQLHPEVILTQSDKGRKEEDDKNPDGDDSDDLLDNTNVNDDKCSTVSSSTPSLSSSFELAPIHILCKARGFHNFNELAPLVPSFEDPSTAFSWGKAGNGEDECTLSTSESDAVTEEDVKSSSSSLSDSEWN